MSGQSQLRDGGVSKRSTTPIKGITLLHPWAFCIQKLGKDVENRSQHITRKGGCVGMYLAIHGGVAPKEGLNDKWFDFIGQVNGFSQQILACKVIRREQFYPYTKVVDGKREFDLPRLIVPGIVAVARVSACVQGHPSPWSVPGEWQYVLEDVLTFDEPLPHRGGQGLWDVQAPQLTQIIQAWEAAHGGLCPFKPKVKGGL